jgi:hypothetical protein
MSKPFQTLTMTFMTSTTHLTANLPGRSGLIHQLFRWLVNGGSHVPPAQQRVSVRMTEPPARSVTRTLVSCKAAPVPSAGSARAPGPQVRVLRLVEGGQPQKAAGRMRISGRMADVCAELDRLAA